MITPAATVRRCIAEELAGGEGFGTPRATKGGQQG